jgi:Acetyltransferase (GNAT) family.
MTIILLHWCKNIDTLKGEFEKSTILKALVDNKIIGSVRGYWDKGTLYIGKLIVDKNYQNKGIAQKLLDAIEQQFQGYTRVELFTGFKSLKNLYLYKKKGYKEFKRQGINDNMTMIFLEKENASH